MPPRKKKVATEPAVDTTTYMMETKGGQQRKVTVPSHWKLTFGPTIPFERKGLRDDSGMWALRFYEGERLRAIFTDVKSFRDMGIEIIEKVVKTQRQTFNKDGKKGGKAVVAEARIEQWINPDDPDEEATPSEFLQLNFDPEDAF